MFTINRKKGFTLVETLVAISILMLAVTGPLYFAAESLKAATYARDQITAFYLAQDAFEQIRKIRDDNRNTSTWNTGLTGCESDTSTCVVAKDVSNFYVVSSSPSCPIDVGDCSYLYLDKSTGIYSHTGGEKTAFRRVVKIEPTDAINPQPGDLWASATEMKVTVYIKWKSGTVARDFTAYEFLRNI